MHLMVSAMPLIAQIHKVNILNYTNYLHRARRVICPIFTLATLQHRIAVIDLFLIEMCIIATERSIEDIILSPFSVYYTVIRDNQRKLTYFLHLEF